MSAPSYADALSRSVGRAPKRPESVRRLTIDHVAERRATEHGFREHLVPLDLARPGDEQVAVPMLVRGSRLLPGITCGPDRAEMWVPIEAEDAPWVSLDVLAGALSSVESVVVAGKVSASRALPNVKELLVVGGRVAPEAWSHLTGLERLAVRDTSEVDVARVSAALEELVVTKYGVAGSPEGWLDELPRLAHLRRLVLPYVRASLAPLARMPSLRELRFAGGRQLSQLGRLELLERVEMEEVKLESLEAFRGWRRVRHLSIVHGVKDLSGIERMVSLEDLTLVSRRLPEDLTPLASLPRLTALHLATLEKVRDFGGLRGVTGLTRLRASAGSASNGVIESLDFVRDMDDLEELWIGGTVRRARLAPLLGKRLTKAVVSGDFGPDAERVREAFSGPGMHVVPVRVEPVRALEPRDADAAGRRFWFLEDDLTEELGLEDNHEVEDAVRAELARRAPELLARLELDSEASLFVMRADGEATIREAIAVIEGLVASRRR